jgi:hypothetical protein
LRFKPNWLPDGKDSNKKRTAKWGRGRSKKIIFMPRYLNRTFDLAADVLLAERGWPWREDCRWFGVFLE